MTALVNPNEEMMYRKTMEILECSCGARNVKHKDTVWQKCSSCGSLLYISPGFTDNPHMEIVNSGRTQDGEWVQIMDEAGNINTYWKEG